MLLRLSDQVSSILTCHHSSRSSLVGLGSSTGVQVRIKCVSIVHPHLYHSSILTCITRPSSLVSIVHPHLYHSSILTCIIRPSSLVSIVHPHLYQSCISICIIHLSVPTYLYHSSILIYMYHLSIFVSFVHFYLIIRPFLYSNRPSSYVSFVHICIICPFLYISFVHPHMYHPSIPMYLYILRALLICIIRSSVYISYTYIVHNALSVAHPQFCWDITHSSAMDFICFSMITWVTSFVPYITICYPPLCIPNSFHWASMPLREIILITNDVFWQSTSLLEMFGECLPWTLMKGSPWFAYACSAACFICVFVCVMFHWTS